MFHKKAHINSEIIFIFVCFLFVFVLVSMSSILNSNISKIGHVYPYLITPVFFILLPYIILEVIGDDKFVHYLFLGATFSAIYVIFHFILITLFNFKLELFLPFIKDENARFIVFDRQRAFAPEPGVAAYFFASLGCLKFFLRQFKNKTDVFFQLLIIVAMLLTFSPQAYLMILAMCIYMIYYKNYRRKLPILSAILVFILLFIPADLFKVGFEIIFAKITLSSESYSASDRLSRWMLAYTFVHELGFLGYGAGSTSILFGSSFTSSFVTLFFEGGFLAFCAFIAIFLRWPSKGNFSLIFPYLSGLLFVSISSTYYIGYVFILRVLLMRKKN